MDKLYFIKLGLKALHYDTLEQAEEARERWQRIYPQFDVTIYVGEPIKKKAVLAEDRSM